MPSTLFTLPVEVIENVAYALDRTSLCTVRLASKALDQMTLRHFGRTYFTVRQTDFSLNDLQRLWAISQTEHLKHHVQTLLIKERQNNLGQGLDWHRVEGNLLSTNLDTRLSLGVQVLRDILRNLTNCRSFHIHGPDFDGRVEHYESKCLRPNDAVHIVFEVVSESGIAVKSFHIVCQGRGGLDTKRLQMQLYQQQKYMAAWENLEELRLEHHPTIDNLGWTRDLILCTVRLKKVAFNLNYNDTTAFLGSIFCSMIPFQGLQEIELERMHTTREMLSALLHCRSSLRKLSFRHVVLEWGAWVQFLRELITFESLEYFALEWPRMTENEEGSRLQFRVHRVRRIKGGWKWIRL